MTKKVRVGLYPGTFDPPTNGHVDIITRAAIYINFSNPIDALNMVVAEAAFNRDVATEVLPASEQVIAGVAE